MSSTASSSSFASRHPLLAYVALFAPMRGRVALAAMLALVKHSPVVFVPLYTGYVLDHVIPLRDPGLLALCALGMVGLIIMNIALHPLYIRLYSRARREVAVRLRARVCERLQQLVFAYYDTANAGRLHSKVMQDVEKLDQLGRVLIDPLLVLLASATAALGIILWSQPAFVLVLVVFAPIILVQRALLNRRVEERFNHLRVEQEKLNAEVGEMIGMLSLSRAHATEDEDLRRVARRMGAVRESGVGADWVQNVLQSQIWGTSQLVNISVVCLGAFLAIQGLMTVGEIVVFLSLVMMTLGGMSAFLERLEVFYAAAEAMRSIDEVLHQPAIEQNAGKPPVPALEGRVEFENVSFTYPGAGESAPVLRDISLRVEPCQTIALVGPSGAGKTTFVKLLLGFYQPTAGRVLVDGQPLDAVDLRSLRRQVGIVTQETLLFNGTIRQNLAHGLPDATDAAIEEAAQRAHAHDFIAALERGYDTEIGDRGLRLSGGQKQRLAIARALLRNPRLLILDEATSALDSQSERAVQEALEELMRGRTVFVVAHRLSTIRHADRILVFERGRIVQDGPHEALLANPGLYARLVELQQVG